MAQLLERAYDSYNKKYFSGKLPKLPVVWSDELGAGSRYGKKKYADFTWSGDDENFSGKIRMASWMKPHWSVWMGTLIHEMCHVSVRAHPTENGSPESRHTRVWKAEMRRVASEGAFDSVW